MAVDLNNTNTHRRFDFQSQNLSSIICENKKHNKDQEDRLLFQNTVPLENSQSGNIVFDTEILDYDSGFDENKTTDTICEHEEEMVVLDSEDDEINGSRIVGVTKSLPDNETQKKTEGCEVSLINSGKEKDLNHELPSCDPELVRLKDNSTREISEWSEADALGFVEHFVSLNNVDLSQGTEYRKTTRDKLFRVSSTNGPQILARRINLRTQVKEKGKFEWIDSDSHEETESDDRGCGSLGNERKERKGISSFCKETTDSTHLESRFAVSSSKDGREIAQVSEVNTEVNSAQELELTEKQYEASDVGGDTLDMCDIGFNTQIAAEAIEALAHGHHFGHSTGDTCQDRENTINEPLRGVTEKNAQRKPPCIQKSSCSDLGNILGNGKRRKRSDRKYGRKTSSSSRKSSGIQELDPELTKTKLVKRKKMFGDARLCCSNSAESDENLGKSPAKPLKLSKAEGSLEKNNTRVSMNDVISSTTIESIPLVNEKSEGQRVKVSPVACQTRLLDSRVMSKTVKDRSSNPVEKKGENIKHGILVYKRKRSGLNANLWKVSFAREKCSKSCYLSEGATMSKLTSFSEVDTWSHPKRKRTGLNVQKHANRTNATDSPLTSNYQERIVGNANMKGKKESPSCKQGHSPTHDSQGSLSGKKFYNLGSTGSILNCARAATSKISRGLAVERAYWQTGKPDDIDSTSVVSEEKNHTSIASSNKTLEPFGLECTTISSKIGKNVVSSNYMFYDYHKRPCDKNVPKSFLLKELINLGVPEHIHKSARKESRKRKDMAHVRILFSQHLDDDIVKQQKKIAARLGISIASCSMDSTHFIADEFARTRNMLEAIALGKPVVTHLWLESCGQASCFIDERNYILRDAKKEKKFGFSMPVSLARANQHPLLKGYKVLITPNVKPDKEMIKNLVKAVHGQLVEKTQTSALNGKDITEDLLIVSCKEDHSICLPFLKKGATVYSSELLLNGIVTQKLQYKRHQLFINDVKRNCSLARK